jgi:putative hydrolase of the HAD superfamily
VPFLAAPLETPPRAIIFDIGRVIIQVDISRSMEPLGRHEGHSHAEVLRLLESDPKWMDWQEGRIAPADWHTHLKKKLGFSYNFEEFCSVWNSVLRPEPILPDRLFESLAGKYRLGLLSNTDPIHVAHFEANYGFVRHFPVRIYSCHVGISKPAPAIYLHALRDLDTMPDEALFIDDLHGNVLAAASQGMSAFHFTGAAEMLAEFSRVGLYAA